MGALLSFAPFIGFVAVETGFGLLPGLVAGALISIALLVYDQAQTARDLNILEAGSAVMFAALAILAYLNGDATWSLWMVRLCVDVGMVLIMLLSMVLGRPFTAHHARRRVSEQVASTARFLKTQYVLSAAWAVAFAFVVSADLLMILYPATSPRLAVGLSAAALFAALRFTRYYTARVRNQSVRSDGMAAP